MFTALSPGAFAGLLMIVGLLAEAPAPSPAPRPPSDELLAESIQTRLKQVEHSVGLDEALRKNLTAYYLEAQQSLETVKDLTEKTTQHGQTALHAPSLIEQAKVELAALPAERTVDVPDGTTVSELEQAIANRESELTRYRTDLERLENEPKARAAARSKNAERSAALRETFTKLNAELQTTIDEKDPLAVAQRTAAWAKRRAVEQELLALDRQVAMYEATTDLLPIQRDLAARRLALAEQEIKQIQDLVNRRRQAEAERQAQTARVEAVQAHPAVRRLAQESASLAEARTELAGKITAITAQLDETHQQLAAVKEQFKRAREKVDAVGLTNAIGLLLRKQRDTLPRVGHRRRNINARQLLIGESQLTLLQLRDRRSEMADIEIRTRAMMGELAGPVDVASPQLEQLVRETLQTQKDYLDALIGDNNSYFDRLVDLDNAERQLVEETEQCGRYIDERVLWITSDAMLETADLRYCGDGLWWLAGPEACRELGAALLDDAVQHPVWPALAIVLFSTLLVARRRLRQQLRAIGERSRKANCYRFAPTLHALLLTLALAAVWPTLMAYLGWRLASPLAASELCKAVGMGLLVAARVFLVVELVRQLCQVEGLADAHFGWAEQAVNALRQNSNWLRWPLLPTVFIAVAMGAQGNDRWAGSLGRAAFVASLVLCAVFLQRILRPHGGVFHAFLSEHRNGWAHRLRYVWYPAAALTPLVLASLAAVGYYYTSQQLAARLALTAYFVLAFVLLRALLLRWIFVSRRKLAIEEARQRRAQAEAAAAASGEEGVGELPTPMLPERDLAAINIQTRRLVEYTLAVAGLLAVWMAWVDVTPALRFLSDVTVWETTVTQSVAEKRPDGTVTTRMIDRAEPITLASLLLAGVALGMMIVAAKNIPGLMELGILQHLPFDAGVRYALSMVSRYVIIIVGLTFACSTIGLGWSKVQWLVAAVGVGLGFGLQEIFANFVSGLIILFERPIRVGDIITVGDVSGKVSRIHMRATTIIDWDRKELIVPNKEFITGRVLNWTLSDQMNRVVINVGVAYGSDTEKVTELLLAAAQQQPLVLSDPPPQVAFQAFGASSLDFVLRCFLPNLDKRVAVIHELHMAIDRAFREANIEIAFPQQDLHIRSIEVKPSGLAPTVTLANEPVETAPIGPALSAESTLPAEPLSSPPATPRETPVVESFDAASVISRLMPAMIPPPTGRRVA
jgi:potassium efflux system protein